MKNIKVLAIALLAMMASSYAAAQGKIVVLNLQVAIMQTDKAKQVFTELNSKSDYAAMKSKFEGLKSELQTMEKDFNTNGVTWSTDKQAEYSKNFDFKNADFKLLAKKLKAENNAATQRLMADMQPKFQKAMAQLVEAENIGLVLDSGAARFASPDYDITSKVTTLINKM